MDALEQSVLLDLAAYGESEARQLGVDTRVLHNLEARGLVYRVQEYATLVDRRGQHHRAAIWAITQDGLRAIGR